MDGDTRPSRAGTNTGWPCEIRVYAATLTAKTKRGRLEAVCVCMRKEGDDMDGPRRTMVEETRDGPPRGTDGAEGDGEGRVSLH